EGPTGIAGIEGGIGLDHVVDQPARAGTQRAAERGDHAGGDGRFEAERIADGDHQLAALEQLGIAERRRWQRHRSIDPHQRRGGRPGARLRTSAGRVAGSSPTTGAVKLRPSRVATLPRGAPPTTWLLVSTRPSGAPITPEPVPPWRPPVLTSSRTTAGPTRST